jgi:hypothetical protein
VGEVRGLLRYWLCGGLLLAGCAHPYRPPALPSDATAVVRFAIRADSLTESEHSSRFLLEAHDFGASCPANSFLVGGAYLGRSDIERNRAEIRVPAGTRIFFSATYRSAGIASEAWCKLDYGFVPEAERSYLVVHSGNRRGCEVTVLNLTSGAPVMPMRPGQCG